MDFKELKSRLARLDTACICDVSRNLRVMDPGIRPINPGLKMIGLAHTVKCKADFLTVIKALHEATEDEVLVIDAEGDRMALVGELFALEAHSRSLGGIVVDGACRDVVGMRAVNIPVYARYTTPLAGTSARIFKTQIPVNCGGVPVSPGDIVFGDEDGIVVMEEKEISGIIASAENIQRIEEKVVWRMKEKKSLLDMLNFFEHYENIRKKKKSQLIFTI